MLSKLSPLCVFIVGIQTDRCSSGYFAKQCSFNSLLLMPRFYTTGGTERIMSCTSAVTENTRGTYLRKN